MLGRLADLAQCEPCPLHTSGLVAGLQGCSLSNAHDVEADLSCAGDGTLDINRENSPARCACTVAQGQDQETPVRRHVGKVAYTDRAIILVEMLPNRARSHKVEGGLSPCSD